MNNRFSIDQATVKRNVSEALLEDVGSGDISAALLDAGKYARARVITREAGVWCGVPWVDETAQQVSDAIEVIWHVADGDRIEPNDVVFELLGPVRALLTAERTMLNFAQLLSGTATRVAEVKALIAHTTTELLDTRKTIPGLRLAQKYAVRCGGGTNHRIGLFDAYLLKENHLAAKGSITAAVEAARQLHPGKPVEVEVETMTQLAEAITVKADIVMLDNFSLEQTREAVRFTDGRTKLEASGGINEATITDIAETGVDYISMGALTKDVRPLDLSMRLIG